MLSFEPSIVFIDDKEDEVEGIIQLYRNEGIGVKFYNADLVEGDSTPTNHFSNVNLVFLDLYYQDDFDIDMCLGWIDSIIEENSFYVLVIWSKDTHHSKDIVERLSHINKKPFAWYSETKDDTYKNPDSSFKWEELKQKISSELEKIPELKELSTWKKSVLNSSNIIIGHLSKGSTPEELRKKLQKIIIGHGGTYLLGNDREIEKRKVLFDALDNILISNSKSSRPKEEITQQNKETLYNIPTFPIADIDSKLNSWFHFVSHKEPLNQSFVKPGLISFFKNISLRKNYNIQNDDNISKYLKNQIEINGDNPKPVLLDISVVISRPCDIAQGKYGKNIKLMSGLLIVNPIRKKNKLKGNDTKPMSIKIYDHLYISDDLTDCSLVFDYRYIFSLPKDIFFERFENLKIFNKELLSEIQVEYSSYSSILGITQII